MRFSEEQQNISQSVLLVNRSTRDSATQEKFKIARMLLGQVLLTIANATCEAIPLFASFAQEVAEIDLFVVVAKKYVIELITTNISCYLEWLAVVVHREWKLNLRLPIRMERELVLRSLLHQK
jgi:hypothetical protein